MKWAGCNYWVNTGKCPEEPVGTASSMHDCNCCEFDGVCAVQKDTSTWAYCEEHDKCAIDESNRLRALKLSATAAG